MTAAHLSYIFKSALYCNDLKLVQAGRNLRFSSEAEPEDLSGELNDLQRLVVRVFVRADVHDHARTAAAGATTQRLAYQLRQHTLSVPDTNSDHRHRLNCEKIAGEGVKFSACLRPFRIAM